MVRKAQVVHKVEIGPDAKNANNRRILINGQQWCKVYGWDRESVEARAQVIAQALTRPQAPDSAPCYDCGSTERIGTACKPCNPELADSAASDTGARDILMSELGALTDAFDRLGPDDQEDVVQRLANAISRFHTQRRA